MKPVMEEQPCAHVLCACWMCELLSVYIIDYVTVYGPYSWGKAENNLLIDTLLICFLLIIEKCILKWRLLVKFLE